VFLFRGLFDRIFENTNVFVSQKYLTLSARRPSLGFWISISQFVTGFDINVGTFRDGAKEGVCEGVETEDSVP